MRIAVIGTGNLARTLAHRFVRLGHEVMIAGGVDPHDMLAIKDATGAKDGTIREAADFADLVIVAIPFHRIEELPPDAFEGRIVVDATDYYPDRDGSCAEIESGEVTSSEVLARHLPGARVVKAFNTPNLRTLGSVGHLVDDVDPVAVPIAGDDVVAKSTVGQLVAELGFDPVDAGTLADSWRLQSGARAHGLAAAAAELRAALNSETRVSAPR